MARVRGPELEPAAYKKIEGVIAERVEAGVARVLATFRPMLTYKVRSR